MEGGAGSQERGVLKPAPTTGSWSSVLWKRWDVVGDYPFRGARELGCLYSSLSVVGRGLGVAGSLSPCQSSAVLRKLSGEEMALALAVSQSPDPRQTGREWTGAVTSFIILLAIYLSISIYYFLPTSFLFFALLLIFVLQSSTHFQPLLSTEILLQALYLSSLNLPGMS